MAGGVALKAHVLKYPAAQCPLPLRVLGEEPPLDAGRPGPRATSPTLIRRGARPMHPESALLRMWLPPHPTYRLTAPHCPGLTDSIIVLRTSGRWNLGPLVLVVESCLLRKMFSPWLRSTPTCSKSL